MDKQERIRRRAYDIWCAAGWPKGRDKEHWEQACREIDGEGDDASKSLDVAAEVMGSQPRGNDDWS